MDANIDFADDLLIVGNKRFLHNEGDEDSDGIPVAIVQINTVRPFTFADMAAACANDFEEGWFAWELRNVRPISTSNLP